jgi:hypothetical protein
MCCLGRKHTGIGLRKCERSHVWWIKKAYILNWLLHCISTYLEVVAADEAVANAAAAASQAIKDECESELAEAIPALEASISALNTLKPQDITMLNRVLFIVVFQHLLCCWPVFTTGLKNYDTAL